MRKKISEQWSRPYGLTTPRVDTRTPQQADSYAASWDSKSPAHDAEVEDRGKRSESDGWDTIWAAYGDGY